MKTQLVTGLILSLTSLTVFAADFSQLAGTYEVSAKGIPVSNTITINENGSVELIEKSPYGILNCAGQATIQENIVESYVVCENGQEFTQRIDLSNVVNFENFTASVYSSLYDMELAMNFSRQ